MRGAALDKKLDRNASNPIARRIKDFRDRASEVLKSIGLDCGQEDIIANGAGGYYLTDWVTVTVASQAHEPAPENEPDRPMDGPAHEPIRPMHGPVREPDRLIHGPVEPICEPDQPANEPKNEPVEPARELLNERQEWILEQIDAGARLRQKQVIDHFRRDKTPSTIKRDLKDLRDRGLIATHSDGHYMRPAGGDATPNVA